MSQTWIDLQPDSVVDVAIDQVQAEDPQAWALFDGESQPCYALWAYLVVGHAQDLPFPAGMDLIEALGESAGLGAYTAGLSPYEASFSLTTEGARSTSRDRDGARTTGDRPCAPAIGVRGDGS